MKKLLFTLLAFAPVAALTAQNGPGLIISELLPNPAGTDSPFEFVELVATRTINFAVTPYTVVACNNGTATTQGWITGGAISYGFEITTGIVNVGDVVYIGGSTMAPTGTILRGINTGTTPGDGFGNANTGGVVGNGGTNADGIGVFSVPVASITNSTVPVDALFYGTGTGTAVVNAGIDGYQLPINDLYIGGKLQTTSFLAPDAASAQYLTATGTFNPVTGGFTTTRTWALNGTFTNAVTAVTISSATPAPTLAFATTNQTVNENAGTVTVTVNITNPNNSQIVFSVAALPISNATAGVDYTQSAVQFTVPPTASTAQVISFPITDDLLAERDEYLVLAFTQLTNATTAANAAHFLYIKDNDLAAPTANNQLFLNLLTSFSNGSSASNSAEIVVHDPSTQRLYIANSIGAKLDILNFSNPAAPSIISTINISAYGNINSVAVNDSVVAMAIENGTNPQDSGKVVFLDYNGTFISQVKVGAMPDMITFNHAGTKVITACEGEPNAAYTNDPDGSVCVVNIAGGVASVNQSNVTFITFTAFNGQEAALRAQGIRIYGPAATTSKDFEPEYVTISDDDLTAWVTLQENNAMVKINLANNTITQIFPLGYKNYVTGASAMDASDQTAGINLSNFPVKGMYLPDALYNYTVNNQTYIVTANEGDARAYTGFNEESRISGLTLDATAFPYGGYMKSNLFLGRLNATNRLGDNDNDGDIDEIYTYGARSFSIWNATTGALVFDSGDDMERITSTNPAFSAMFNASNSTSPAPKNRSDDKGPEPEGVVISSINGEQYAFIAVERIGGVMIYNITNPLAPSYVGYYNNRSFATNGPDRGSEGIIFIPASASPNGAPLVILANETSSTLTVFQVETCAQRAGVAITPATPPAICQGDSLLLTGNTVSNTTYQWLINGNNINGATGTTYYADSTAAYQLFVNSTTHACSGKTAFANLTVNPRPTVTASAPQTTVCNGVTATLNGGGATTYNWMPGNLSGSSVGVTPSTATTYTVTGTALGCSNTATVTINVNALPTVTASTQASSICNGSSVLISSNGATTYSWLPGPLSGSPVSVSPTSTTTYTVTGTNVNGCTNTATVAITVLTRPTVAATISVPTLCSGNSTTLTGTGASTYTWLPGLLTGNIVNITPASTTTYTLTGAGTNGCTNTATVSVTVNQSPNVTATPTSVAVCGPQAISMNANGAITYSWMPGSLSGNSVSVTPASSTTYTVTGTAANGCTDSVNVAVTVNTPPVVALSALQPDSLCSNDSPVILSGSPAGGTYTGAGVSGNMFTPATAGPGSHQLIYSYTDVNGCSGNDSTIAFVDICTGIENVINGGVTVYPNPFSEVLTITAPFVMEQIDLYDLSGKLISSKKVQDKVIALETAQLNPGIYIVRVSSSETSLVFKVSRI